jgi:flagellar biosynthetic protein FlhB
MVPAVMEAASAMLRAAALPATAAAAWHAVLRVAFTACGTGLLFALAEYGAARSAWLRKLRMSFEERKREAKEQDGDPFARGRRRALHRSLLRGALADVKDASFVVANPTHVAVALVYRPPDIAVPRVVVRAAGEAALRVRALAADAGIPIVENVPLARALYRDGRVGAPIAHAHYVAVAEIVAALARAKT